ncbi:hypothetical protein IC235_13160 [Hymenobacter sp. BT664]|uniref:Uncharacterized protein n=1 Tax=Hymenobacter montanus TaxID=2771359 RepID=A0A927BF68_9BACT|nr:hypothetical protein [Hymenobacter montanus]MBD2768838.1 hypothetical protein [Hymenobacter montanus]
MYAPIELTSRTIFFRPDLRVMVVRWHTHVPLEAVQADYGRMLAAAEQFGFSDWLLDVRRRDQASAELSAWVSSTFYPVAVERLAPRRLRIAVLSSPALADTYRSDPDQRRYVAYVVDDARPFDLQLFADEGQAMHWLSPLT